MRPVTDEQWQDAVDAAYFMQQIEMARLFGLVTGGPEINLESCVEILEDGRELGILPRLEQISRCGTESRFGARNAAEAPWKRSGVADGQAVKEN